MATDIRWPEWGSSPRSNQTVEWQGHHGELLDQQGEYQIIACKPCILTHVVPLPSEAWLEAYYKEHFYAISKPDYLRGYIEDLSWWSMWHEVTLRQAQAYLNGSPHPLRVLDVGTGPGIFLSVAKKLGWNGWGLEPAGQDGSALKDYHRTLGIQTCACTLKQYAEDARELGDKHPMAPFDFIHAYEVLEHVPQPDVFLEQCYDLLRPGGVLAITTPNDYNTLQMAACERLGLPHYWLSPPEHLNYFSAKTLQLLLRRSGFTIRDLRGTFPLEQFILQGRNYLGWDTLGRECHHERVAYEMAIHKAGLFDWLLDQYRRNVEHSYSYAVGREITCIAQKGS